MNFYFDDYKTGHHIVRPDVLKASTHNNNLNTSVQFNHEDLLKQNNNYCNQ